MVVVTHIWPNHMSLLHFDNGDCALYMGHNCCSKHKARILNLVWRLSLLIKSLQCTSCPPSVVNTSLSGCHVPPWCFTGTVHDAGHGWFNDAWNALIRWRAGEGWDLQKYFYLSSKVDYLIVKPGINEPSSFLLFAHFKCRQLWGFFPFFRSVPFSVPFQPFCSFTTTLEVRACLLSVC